VNFFKGKGIVIFLVSVMFFSFTLNALAFSANQSMAGTAGNNGSATQPSGGSWIPGLDGAMEALNQKIGQLGSTVSDALNQVAQTILAGILMAAGFIVGLAGMFFDQIIVTTVFRISTLLGIGNNNILQVPWMLLRDIANLFLVFILAYIAIRIIIDSSYQKHSDQMVSVIIIAILLNFSYFITAFFVDISNFVSINLYKGIVGNEIAQVDAGNAGISAGYMASLKLPIMFKGNVSTGISVNSGTSEVAKNFITGSPGLAGIPEMLIKTVFFTAIMLFLALIFLISGILVVSRFLVIIFALIISPLAFVSRTYPKMKTIIYDFWEKSLTGAVIFLPIFLIMTYLSMVLTSALISSPASASHPFMIFNINIINYAVIVGAMLSVVLVTTKVVDSTTSMITSKLTKSASWAAGKTLGVAGSFGRNTLGRVGQRVANSEDLQEKARKGSWLAKRTLQLGNYGANASFDARAGIEKVSKGSIGKGISSITKGTGVSMNFGKAKDTSFEKNNTEYEKEQKKKEAGYAQRAGLIDESGKETAKLKDAAKTRDIYTEADTAVTSAKNDLDNLRKEANLIQADFEQAKKAGDTVQMAKFLDELDKQKDLIDKQRENVEKLKKAKDEAYDLAKDEVKRESEVRSGIPGLRNIGRTTTAAGGAAAGAAIGSAVVPVIGTAVGAGVGAAVGAITGPRSTLSRRYRDGRNGNMSRRSEEIQNTLASVTSYRTGGPRTP
jgi:hypothetical protein